MVIAPDLFLGFPVHRLTYARVRESLADSKYESSSSISKIIPRNYTWMMLCW